MRRFVRQALIWGLAGCLLLLSGLIYPQTVPHAAHHAHHHAAAHATVLCSWMCAADVALQSFTVVLEHDLHPLHIPFLVVPEEQSRRFLVTASLRGPPPPAL